MRAAALHRPDALGVGVAVAALAVGVAAVGAGATVPVLLLALVAPLLAAIVRRPQRGLLLLAALVPFDGLLLLVPGGASVSGWKEALVLLTVGATFVTAADARRPAGRARPAWLAGIVAFTALGLLSALAVGGTQGVAGAKIGFFYLLVAVAAWRCPLDGRERDRLVTVLVAAGVVTATYGVAQQLLGPARLNALGYEYNSTIRFAGGYLRSFSTFVQPFPFGFFMMLVLLVGITQVYAEPRRLRSRLFLLAAPLLLGGLATSLVRGAWLGLAAGVLYLAVTRHRSLLLALPLAVVGLVTLPPETSAAVLSATSSEERVTGWESNVARVVERPLGEGLGATGAAAVRVRVETGSDDPVYQPDNYFVKTAIELGVIGLWLFVLVLISAFGTARRATARGGRDGALAAATAAYVVAAAVASLFSTFFEIFPMEVYFWLLLTVVTGMVAVPVALPARQRAGPLAVAS